MTLYVSHQLIGGNENWEVTQATADFSKIRPTFVTVLATDTILAKDSPKDLVERVKFFGPLYFDLDSEDLSQAIAGAKALVVKLKSYGLEDSDIEVFLSGKKGLHVLVSPTVFMEKQIPVHKLPTIYKEMAFTLAVDTLDFAVYSARRGRMFRTCYNVRENGNYKVPITCTELSSLTPENYNELCKHPRAIPKQVPAFRAKLSILYEGIRQKVSKLRKQKVKIVDAQTLKSHLPTVQRLMQGDRVKEGIGFNKIAIQLGAYAQAARLTEDEFILACEGLITKHTGDGYRYNSAFKRSEELRRMYHYLEDNSSYEYAIAPISAMLQQRVSTDEAAEEFDEDTLSEIDTTGGVFEKNLHYFVASEQGDKHIMDGVFRDCTVLSSTESGQISCLSAKLQVGKKSSVLSLERADFTSSSALHRAVSAFGASFTGSDTHSRYLYSLMLRESKVGGVTKYATEREGLDVINIPFSDIPEAREPFIIWADPTGVKLPQSLKEKGLDIAFMGYPDVTGVVKTDLAKAPVFPAWAGLENNREVMLGMVKNMLVCQDPTIVGKMLGWSVSCFYSQLFRKLYNQFPLLHVNGAAGSGKTQMTIAFNRMFYYKGESILTSPNAATIFSLEQMLAQSASIPIIIDEYKVASMGMARHEEIKSVFRGSYNAMARSKGGGNRMKDNFNAVTTLKIKGPIIFIAEAIEQEVATLERCVVVTIRRPSGRLSAKYSSKWEVFKRDSRCLSIIGQHLAADIIQNYTLDRLREEFDPIHAAFLAEHINSAIEEEGRISRKPKVDGRLVYNHSVAYYGLLKFKEAICLMFPEEAENFKELMQPLEQNVFTRIEDVTNQTVPEYIKVLQRMSDMTRFEVGEIGRMQHKVEYELGNIGEKQVIHLVTRLAFNRYREYCRRIGETPLFNGDTAFTHALRDSNFFIQTGEGTSRMVQESYVLDYDEMLKSRIPVFAK